MVIVCKDEDNIHSVYYLEKYVPYKNTKENKLPTRSFTRKIMDLKAEKEPVIRAFYNRLDPEFAKGIAITCVPSHDPAKTSSGILTLARLLAANGRIDATSCIQKLHKTEPMHNGGPRNREKLKASLALVHPELITGRDVLLLDDVHTSGTSLEVCQELLYKANPKKVIRFALGYTTHLEDIN